MPPREDKVLERDLELSVMGAHFPVRILLRFDEFRRHVLARGPQLHRLIVGRIGTAQDLDAGIGGVPPNTNIFELEHAAAFVITVQDVFGHLVRSLWIRARLRASTRPRARAATLLTGRADPLSQ